MTQERSENLLAQVALAAHEKNGFSAIAPSDAEMAEFIEGRIQGARREEILAYLRADPQAFRDWQDTLDALATLDAPEKKSEYPASSVAKKLRHWLETWFLPVNSGWAAAIATLVLALLSAPLWWPEASPLDSSYRVLAATAEPERLQQIAQNLPGSAGRTLSFASGSPMAEAQQEFSAGVRYGRQILITGAAKTDARRDSYFELGRWCVLIWSAAHSGQELPGNFWEAQQQWFAVLKNELIARHTLDLDKDLAEIQAQLQRLPSTQPSIVYEQLGYLSGQLLKQLNAQP